MIDMRAESYRKNQLLKERQAQRERRKRRAVRKLKENYYSEPRVELSLSREIIFYIQSVVFATLFIFFVFFQSAGDYFQSCHYNNNKEISSAYASYDKISGPYWAQQRAKSESKDANKILFKRQISAIIKNAPMKEMVDDVVERDRIVAAFLVGIAMKESKFGTYSPKKDGKECYNYWGYRGKENTTKSGYSCFDSHEQAVQVVGDRIEALVKQGRRNPSQMIVWKCGFSCNGHSKESVDKWIKDVSIHYYGLNPDQELARK